MYPFQGWTENFSGWTAPRSGAAAAQRNDRGWVLKEHVSEKRHRRDPQRAGARARLETDEISGLKPGRSIALFYGRGLQCETIPKSARIPDENPGAQPGLSAQGRSFFWLWPRGG